MATLHSPIGECESLDHSREHVVYVMEAMSSCVGVATDESSESFFGDGTKYIFRALLGDGGFGSVFRCSTEVEGQTQMYAVKVINTQKISMMCGLSQEKVFLRMLRETDVMQRLKGHPHVVEMYRTYASRESLRLYIVMELLEGGDLFSEIVRRRRPFNETDARTITQQLLSATTHCHDIHVAHRDIKLENVLIASLDPLVIKLCDYGQAKPSQSGSSAYNAKTLTTTPIYTPPEVVQAVNSKTSHDAFKVDSFGIGVILYGLLCNALPDAARGGDYETHPHWKRLSPLAQDLVRQLLDPNPDRRLAVRDVGQHPWLQGPGNEVVNRAAAQAGYSPFCGNNSPIISDGGGSSARVDELELKTVLALQALQQALQRERGASCWFLASAEGGRELRWRCKLTNEQLKDSEGYLAEQEQSRTKAWGSVQQMLQDVRKETERLRQICVEGTNNECNEEQAKDFFEKIFGGYCVLCERLGQSVVHMLSVKKGNNGVAGQREMRLRLLLLAAEQLGRERGFLCGHISRPHWMKSASVRERLARMQASRQVLLGSSKALTDEVVVSNTGIMHALGLTDKPPLSQEDILELEEAEVKASTGKASTPEWFALLTKLIDKIHRMVSIGIVELLSNPQKSARILSGTELQ